MTAGVSLLVATVVAALFAASAIAVPIDVPLDIPSQDLQYFQEASKALNLEQVTAINDAFVHNTAKDTNAAATSAVTAASLAEPQVQLFDAEMQDLQDSHGSKDSQDSQESQDSQDIPDYLYFAANDPAAALRSASIQIRKALIGYASLKEAGLTNLPSGYVQNVTVPKGTIGNLITASGQAGLAVELINYQALYEQWKAMTLADPSIVLSTLKDYEGIYKYWPKPMGLVNWASDAHFGRLRLTYYPILIQKTKPTDLDVLQDKIPVFDWLALRAKAALGLLYHEDYTSALQTWNLTAVDRTNLKAQFALFLSSASTLVPVGIVVDGQWVVPTDGDAWMLAKIACNSIDSNLIPMEHFSTTHIQLSPLAWAMQRLMGDDHPFKALLAHPLEYTAGLFAVGFPSLFNKGTKYDIYSEFSSLGMHNYLNVDWARVPWTSRYFDIEMDVRGLTNLPGFDYRDDLLEHQRIAKRFIRRTLALYYPTDASVVADTELQAVFAEASSPAFGKLYGFPSQATSVDQLIDIITHVYLMVPKHHQLNTVAISQVLSVLPYAPWLVKCAWPGKAFVNESYIMEQCMPNKAESMELVAGAASYARPSPASYKLLYSPETGRTGTLNGSARKKYARDLLDFSLVINQRPVVNVTLPQILLNPAKIPRSTFA